LLKVAGFPILEQMIVNCQACGLREFVIVLGYLEDKIRQFIHDRFPRLKVTFVVNDKFETTNTGYSLMLAKEAVDGKGIIKFDADVVFDQKVLQRLMAKNADNALCIDRIIKLDAEEVKVVVDASLRVLRVGKDIAPKEAKGESIGIEKLSPEAATQLFATLHAMMTDEAHHQDYYEAGYERLIAAGVGFHVVDVTGLNWIEIDTVDDFDSANQMFATTMHPAPRTQGHLHLLDASNIQSFRRR